VNACISAAICADVMWINASSTNRMGHSYIGGFPEGGLEGDEWQVGYKTVIDTWIITQSTNLALPGGDGTAVFGTFVRKTQVIHPNISGELRPKPTALNKRTVPVF